MRNASGPEIENPFAGEVTLSVRGELADGIRACAESGPFDVPSVTAAKVGVAEFPVLGGGGHRGQQDGQHE